MTWKEKNELAKKVAEYVSFARMLRIDSNHLDYIKANSMCWELAILLPDTIYIHMMNAITNSSTSCNELSVMIEMRKWLNEDPGELTQNDIGHHSPGIGEANSNN